MKNKKNTKKTRWFDNMDKGVLCSADMKKTKYKILYATLVLIMVIYCLIVFVPCLWLLVSGFKSATELYARPVKFFPEHFSLKKLTDAWKELGFYKYYLNTFVMSIGCVAFDVFFNGLAGFVISRLKPKGTKVVSVIIFSLMMLPTTMSTVPLYMTFKDVPYLHVSLLDTYLPMMLLAGANTFNILMFKSAFDGVSNSLVEAAKIDGASNMQIFFKIMLPLCVPVIVTVSLLTFNWQFGNFFWPYLTVSDPNKAVLGIKMYMMKSSNLTVDYQMITILFAILPQLIVFIIFQKYIIGGVNVGGVKG